MSLFFILSIISICAVVLVIPILFLLRHARVYKEQQFSRMAFLICIIWSFVIILGSAFPIDYWHNPPFSKIIRIPPKADVISCYNFYGDQRKEFDNPWVRPEKTVFRDKWFKRRGFKELFGLNKGDRFPEVEALAEEPSAICVFKYSNQNRAVIMQRSWGGSSGDNFITLKLLHEKDGSWQEVRKEQHDRSEIDDIFVRPFILFFFALSFAALLITVIPSLRLMDVPVSDYKAPKRLIFMLLPSYCLCLNLAIIIGFILPSFVMSIRSGSLEPMPILMAMGCFLIPLVLAYGGYRLASYVEKRLAEIKTLR